MSRLLRLFVLGLAAVLVASAAEDDRPPRWLPAWVSAQQIVEPGNLPPSPGLSGRALRQEVQLSLGGESVRILLSNTFGDGPFHIDAAWVAPSAGGGVLQTRSPHPLTFAGVPEAIIPAGETFASDPVPLAVAAFDRLAISLRLGAVPERLTGHPGSRTTSYVTDGDRAADPKYPSEATRVVHWYFLAGVEVRAPASAAAIVVLGDSIADGRGSTTDGHDRWPDRLARRLVAVHPGIAVLNQGIGGNRVLRDGLGPTALARLERDVLTVPGVRWLILHEGVNDLGAGASATELIEACREIIRRTHQRGIRILGATILPFEGSGYSKPGTEAERQTLNRWIRESGEFDAVIDFDAAARDPERPARLAPAFDGGDHLHPSAEGYRLMAEAVDLGLFAD